MQFILERTNSQCGGEVRELTDYRNKLIERLGTAVKEFQAACLAVKDPYAPIEEAVGVSIRRLCMRGTWINWSLICACGEH